MQNLQPAPTVATRQNVTFRSSETSAAPEKRNFLIAPTMSMKTKVEFWRDSIAPTILMKIQELIVFSGKCHDVIETIDGYPIN
jgi:hypothetical protein